ncbi:MAG TPA: hypothetical protein VGL77_01165 [Armatimonadota bacterium]|jgi:hypothetical protein
MTYREKTMTQDFDILNPWIGQPLPPAGLLEERVLELERMGLLDVEDLPGVPSSIRQFATASLLHKKPPYFVTLDDDLLEFRDTLEARYGLMIFSIPEALMLLREIDGPPN